jgi:DNA-binding LytR/AlgR family response regulator
MKTIRCIIVEDEPVEQKILQTHLKQLPQIEIIKIFSNPVEAITLLQSGVVDLMFLDVELPELSGFELIKAIKLPPKTILITAHTDLALEAYEVGISDYLVKPYNFERLLKAINRVMNIGVAPQIISEESIIFLKSGRDLLKFKVNDIRHIEAYGSFTKVHTSEKIFVISEAISMLQERMPTNTFLRVHKSYLVAKNRIMGISAKNIILKDKKIPLGISYREGVQKILGSNI